MRGTGGSTPTLLRESWRRPCEATTYNSKPAPARIELPLTPPSSTATKHCELPEFTDSPIPPEPGSAPTRARLPRQADPCKSLSHNFEIIVRLPPAHTASSDISLGTMITPTLSVGSTTSVAEFPKHGRASASDHRSLSSSALSEVGSGSSSEASTLSLAVTESTPTDEDGVSERVSR